MSMRNKNKLIRITTVPISLEKLLEYQLRFMQQYYEVTAISADNENLQRVGEKEGVRVFNVELTRQITPIKDLKALWRLYKFLKREKPLIVHTHTPKAGTIGMLAAKLAGVTNRLHTIAGLPLLEAKGNKRKLLNLVEKITYACASRIYPNSTELKKIIIKEGFCAPEKLKVIGNGSSNGINTVHFDASLFSNGEKDKLKGELGIVDNDFVFIFIGRMVGDKGVNELVQAFHKNYNGINTVKLLLLGALEPDLDPLSTDTMVTLSTSINIVSVGYKNDIRPYLAISNALVFPSYREGFPNVVMQAGAMGLPAIVSDINGCNEIIVDGENGIIIPVKNVEAICVAMNKLVSDESFRSRLLTNAREMIVSRYEQKIVWNAILAEYRNFELNV